MSTKAKYYLKGQVAPDGVTISFDHPEIVRQLFFPLTGKELSIEVSRFSKSRSSKQNRWLWGVAYMLIKQYMLETSGEVFTLDEIHAHNLQYIQPQKKEVKHVHGQEVIVVKTKRTSEMSTVEFSEMKERLQQWYAENYDLIIPDPIENSLTTDYANLKTKYR